MAGDMWRACLNDGQCKGFSTGTDTSLLVTVDPQGQSQCVHGCRDGAVAVAETGIDGAIGTTQAKFDSLSFWGIEEAMTMIGIAALFLVMVQIGFMP